MIIHMMHTRVKPSFMSNPKLQDLVSTITLLYTKGDPIEGYHRCLVDFNMVLVYIGKHQTTKNRFFFVMYQKKVLEKSFILVKSYVHNNIFFNLNKTWFTYHNCLKTVIHYILEHSQIEIQTH